MEPSRAVVRSRHHVRAGGRLGRDRRLRGARRRCHPQGEPQPEPPRWVHWSHSANASTPPPDRSTTVTPRRARPSCRNSTRMNPLALRAKRVLSDRKSTRLNSSHLVISYAVFCLKKKKTTHQDLRSCESYT